MAKAPQSSNKTSDAVAWPAFNKRGLPGSFSSQRNVSVAAKHHEHAEPMARALSGDMVRNWSLVVDFYFLFKNFWRQLHPSIHPSAGKLSHSLFPSHIFLTNLFPINFRMNAYLP